MKNQHQIQSTEWTSEQLEAAATVVGIFIEMDLEQRRSGSQKVSEEVNEP